MSGIDSGTGGTPPPTGSCETLVIDTLISSPKAKVIAKIAVGDVLDVDLDQEEGHVTVVVKHQGKIAGGLTSPLLQRLRTCIQNGTRYKAKVTVKNDALVRVRVSAL